MKKNCLSAHANAAYISTLTFNEVTAHRKTFNMRTRRLDGKKSSYTELYMQTHPHERAHTAGTRGYTDKSVLLLSYFTNFLMEYGNTNTSFVHTHIQILLW